MPRRRRRGTVGRPTYGASGPGFPRAAAAPAQPPPGYYDPALDASLAAGQRGYGDLQADTERDFGAGYGGGRAGHDYQLGLDDLAQQRTRGLDDLTAQQGQVEQGYDRTSNDLYGNRRRGREDTANALEGLTRSYSNLATSQAQGARHSGVTSSGLAAKAAAIRAGNMELDRQPIDLASRRSEEDFKTNLGRAGEDRRTAVRGITTAFNRVGEDYSRDVGRLGLGYQRQTEDAQTGLSRAGREQSQFGLDTNAARVFQATQLGWNPSPTPGPSKGKRRRRGRGVLYGTAGSPSYGANF